MGSDREYDEAKRAAARWGQEHLLRFYEELSPGARAALLGEIRAVDFQRICALYAGAAAARPADIREDAGDIRPYGAVDKRALPADRLREACALGMGAMRSGRYAVVTMAGGQGTRLGHPGPKGTFAIQLDRNMTLFEVQLRRIDEMRRRTGRPLPWYIMTSDENHEATVSFFQDRRFFGCDDIAFFRQSSLPMIGFDGKILLEDKHWIRQGPDGNGSVFKAMLESGVADDMRRRGVEWFFMGNVDNILAQCVDPLPVGLAMLRGARCTTKSVAKRSPGEKVGVYCRRNGRPCVIEYTELPRSLAELTDAEGKLVYGDAHISAMVFHIGVLDSDVAKNMPYHTAVKKAPYLDETGNKIVPDTENAYKFEAFIFDIFPHLGDLVVLRVDRDEEFAPIKNAHGEDSPETAARLYMQNLEKQKT